jgi:hypothetical protein
MDIGPNLADALKVIFGCLVVIAFFRYVIGSKE